LATRGEPVDEFTLVADSSAISDLDVRKGKVPRRVAKRRCIRATRQIRF